jgi:hypothetical protein
MTVSVEVLFDRPQREIASIQQRRIDALLSTLEQVRQTADVA